MKKAWKIVWKTGIIAVAVIIVLITVFECNRAIGIGLEKQIIDNLEDVAEQSSVVLGKEIVAKQRLLKGMSNEISELGGENKEEILEHLEPYVDVYGVKRIGFIYPDGTAYTTDGYTQDLSNREYFWNAVRGYADITVGIKDKVDKNAVVNVFAMPVYGDEESVIGVVFATYDMAQFKEILSVKSFSGQGTGIVIQSDGTVIAGSDELNIKELSNSFDIFGDSESEKYKEKSVRKDIMKGKSGYTRVNIEGEEYFAYYKPVDAEIYSDTWYMIDIISVHVLESRIDNIYNYVKLLIAVIVVVVVIAFVIYFITHFKQKRELTNLAYIDPLTKGNNYAYFKMRMRRKRNKTGFIVAMDIDEFRIINNICGVLVGDALLQNVHKVMMANLHVGEMCARLNADRFVLYFLETDKDTIVERIKNIRDGILEVEKTLNIPKVYPFFGIYKMRVFDDVESGYGYATQAKHIIKGKRHESYCFYEDIDYKQRIENKKLEDGFEEAIRNRRFEVWYQPKFDTQTGMVVSSEALVRWRDTNGTLIPPGRFIPLFEKNGMIATLDEYVFDEVCRSLKQWTIQGRALLPVSINISRISLYYPDIAEKYRAIVDSYGLDPKYVQIEITESATIENNMINQLLDKFHKYGFILLLDDFGNGYSSLSTLNEMKFDTLKLDKSLIDYIGDKNGELLLFHIIKLAHNLGLHITAEGVETKNQVDFLKTLECDDIQGYYFSKPLPKIDYEVMLV